MHINPLIVAFYLVIWVSQDQTNAFYKFQSLAKFFDNLVQFDLYADQLIREYIR